MSDSSPANRQALHQLTVFSLENPPPEGLHLLPAPLGPLETAGLPPAFLAHALGIQQWLVEDLKSARRMLAAACRLQGLDSQTYIGACTFELLGKQVDKEEVRYFLENARMRRQPVGVLSEAGTPGIADPGALAAAEAQRIAWTVYAHPGPNSLLLTLMGSGFNGQQFRFVGYLPRDKANRRKMLGRMEQIVRQRNETQCWIETPYRNEALLEDAFAVLGAETPLCIGVDLGLPTQLLRTRPVADWATDSERPSLHKRPAVFALGRTAVRL